MSEMIHVGNMPILALRGLVIFPDQTVHFEVGRTKSILALEEAMKGDQTLLLIPQKDIAEDDPELDGLHAMGTVAKIKQHVSRLFFCLAMYSSAYKNTYFKINNKASTYIIGDTSFPFLQARLMITYAITPMAIPSEML